MVITVVHLACNIWQHSVRVVLQEQPSPVHHCAGEPRGLLAHFASGD